MARIISVSNNKGGILKTTTTVSAGVVLAKMGYRVLLVDTDNQGNVYLSFGNHPDGLQPTIYEVMMGESYVKDAIYHIQDNLDVIPSNDRLELLDFEVLSNKNKFPQPFYLLRDHIAQLENDYDFILIDTPPNLGLIHGNVMATVREVLIPFQPEVYSMRSLGKMLNFIDGFRNNHNPTLKVMGVVATLVDNRTNLHKDIIGQAEEFCRKKKVRMFQTQIPRTISYANSLAYQRKPLVMRLIMKRKQKKQVDDSYYNLVGEILK